MKLKIIAKNVFIINIGSVKQNIVIITKILDMQFFEHSI